VLGHNPRSDRREVENGARVFKKRGGGKGKERREEAREKGWRWAQSAEASSAGWRLRQRAEVGGGRSGAAATQRSAPAPFKKPQGVAWGLVFAVVKVSVAWCFPRLAA